MNVTQILPSKELVIENCKVMDLFSIIVQILLGLIAFSALIYKRNQESPPRPWKVWSLDVSKQGIGALIQHFSNVGLSLFFTTKVESNDECLWYFLNQFLDTTLGIFLCSIILKIYDYYVNKYNIDFLKNGVYFKQEKIEGHLVNVLIWKAYISQVLIWIVIIIAVKTLLIAINNFCKNIFEIIGLFILSPFNSYPKFELLMVMIVFPLFFNTVYFWVYDNLLKYDEQKGVEETSEKEPLLPDKNNIFDYNNIDNELIET